MISQSQLDYFKEVGIWYTGVPAFDSSNHESCMRAFLAREEVYKHDFLQTKLNKLFEGYSYIGQDDSLNQGSYDNLYTYVLSDFFDRDRHPKEFQPIFREQETLVKAITDLEKSFLKVLDADLFAFYEEHVVHSLSANFYPPNDSNQVRLTPHPDGSLLTVFPFGMDEEFQFETPDGKWQTVEKTNEVVCFSGYLMERMTDIKALNHKVEKKGPQHERFSFAYFAIPHPDHHFQMKGEKVSSEDYFARYLSLFE